MAARDGDCPVIGRCQHCNVAIFDNPNADPALDSMAHLCWKCCRPWRRPAVVSKTLDTLAVGDVIIDPQGRRHTVLALAEIVDEDGDRGMAITVEYDAVVCPGTFTEVREVVPVGDFSSVTFRVEQAAR
jgi:hypothetical protein